MQKDDVAGAWRVLVRARRDWYPTVGSSVSVLQKSPANGPQLRW